jgi:hypothetical protein
LVIQSRSSGRKPGGFLVAAPVLQVGLLVRDIDVAAEHEVALGLEVHQVAVHLGQKAELASWRSRPSCRWGSADEESCVNVSKRVST